MKSDWELLSQLAVTIDLEHDEEDEAQMQGSFAADFGHDILSD